MDAKAQSLDFSRAAAAITWLVEPRSHGLRSNRSIALVLTLIGPAAWGVSTIGEVARLERVSARAAGLHCVYLGNLRDVADAENTYCPNCRRAVIERDVFAVTSSRLAAGACPFCHTHIAGVWPERVCWG